MFYLICRSDQIPENFDTDKPLEFQPPITYYPRIVFADDPAEAVTKAFAPERYKPAGVRELVAIELGEIHQLVATPVTQPSYTVSKRKPKRPLLRTF